MLSFNFAFSFNHSFEYWKEKETKSNSKFFRIKIKIFLIISSFILHWEMSYTCVKKWNKNAREQKRKRYKYLSALEVIMRGWIVTNKLQTFFFFNLAHLPLFMQLPSYIHTLSSLFLFTLRCVNNNNTINKTSTDLFFSLQTIKVRFLLTCGMSQVLER